MKTPRQLFNLAFQCAKDSVKSAIILMTECFVLHNFLIDVKDMSGDWEQVNTPSPILVMVKHLVWPPVETPPPPLVSPFVALLSPFCLLCVTLLSPFCRPFITLLWPC